MQTGVMCYTGYTGGLRDVQATQGGCVMYRVHRRAGCCTGYRGGICSTGYISGCDLYRLHMGAVCCTSYTEGAM